MVLELKVIYLLDIALVRKPNKGVSRERISQTIGTLPKLVNRRKLGAFEGLIRKSF